MRLGGGGMQSECHGEWYDEKRSNESLVKDEEWQSGKSL